MEMEMEDVSEMEDVWKLFDDLSLCAENKTTMNNIPMEMQCDFCSNKEITLVDGDYTCLHCNTLVCRYIDASAEWRIFNGDDNKGANMIRCGMPTMQDTSLGSLMGFGNVRETAELRIMRRYHMWNSTTYKERSLYTIFDMLSLNAMNNGISKSIIEEAKALYKRVSDTKSTRGNNRSGLIAASVYMACKNNQVPRSTREIAGFFNVKINVMTKSCKKVQEILQTNIKSTKAEDFISRFGSKINLDRHQKELCKWIIGKAEEEDLVSNNTPPSIAAAAIHTACVLYNWNVNKKELAEACEVSLVTILKCSKKILASETIKSLAD
jgi:transcription initiation factor TFIIB